MCPWANPGPLSFVLNIIQLEIKQTNKPMKALNYWIHLISDYWQLGLTCKLNLIPRDICVCPISRRFLSLDVGRRLWLCRILDFPAATQIIRRPLDS